MYVRYGNYLHDFDEVAVATSQRRLYGWDGVPYAIEETWNLKGFKQAATTAALLPLLNLLEAAYLFPGYNLDLIANDGKTLLRRMAGISRLGGARPQGVLYPQDGAEGAEFTTYRNYNITVIGCYPIFGPSIPANPLIEWDDHLQFSGGGPIFAHLVPVIDFPQKQNPTQHDSFKVRQVGRATGLYDWPKIAPPTWPLAVVRSPNVERLQPQASWLPIGRVFHHYTVTWEYLYEDKALLLGSPRLPVFP